MTLENSPPDQRNSISSGFAWVAGASEGLGLAFAEALAADGHALFLIARRAELLETEAARIRERYGVEVVPRACDLGADDLDDRLAAWTRTYPPVLAVYNAAFVPVGGFLEMSTTDLAQAVAVNALGPMLFARHTGAAMAERGRGALILMSSLAGLQGSPRLAAYAATKAFNIMLAEALWHELRARGVDVHVCCAGAVRTPGYAQTSGTEAIGIMDADAVVRKTLARVGKGPRIVPGWINRLSAQLMARWLPRRLAIATMASATRDLSE